MFGLHNISTSPPVYFVHILHIHQILNVVQDVIRALYLMIVKNNLWHFIKKWRHLVQLALQQLLFM